jgi:hypothetical protein
MPQRTGLFAVLLACSAFTLPGAGEVHADPARPDPVVTTQQAHPGRLTGKVTDVAEAAGYTYAEVDTGSGKVWAATPTTPVKVGDTIAFTTEMPMENFHSNAMNRDFPVVYFVRSFMADTAAGTARAPVNMASPHDAIAAAANAGPVKGIDKVKGGYNIAELYDGKKTLAGKTVRVRGKVTRYTAGVMGKNWIHIRDSSSADDLAVTTSGTAALDNVIVVEGKLELNKDYGYGYVYPLIVEDATVTQE